MSDVAQSEPAVELLSAAKLAVEIWDRVRAGQLTEEGREDMNACCQVMLQSNLCLPCAVFRCGHPAKGSRR